MIDVNYFAPANLDEAVKLIAANKDGLKVLAGGTDIMPKINYYKEIPKAVMYLGGVGLDFIEVTDDGLVIGAGTPIAKILQSELIAKAAPVLAEAAAEHSSPAIRSVATIGGNIVNASPAADMVPPLYALDAVLTLVGPGGARSVKIEEFFTGPGKTVRAPDELLKDILVPNVKGKAAFIKLGKRKAQVLSVVSVAARLVAEGGNCVKARIAIGSVAPTVIRCPEAEAMLAGKQITPELLCEAAKAAIGVATPIDDSRATAWYRKEAGLGIVKKALFTAAGLEYTD